MLLSAHTMAENSASGRLAIQLAVDARTCNIQRVCGTCYSGYGGTMSTSFLIAIPAVLWVRCEEGEAASGICQCP